MIPGVRGGQSVKIAFLTSDNRSSYDILVPIWEVRSVQSIINLEEVNISTYFFHECHLQTSFCQNKSFSRGFQRVTKITVPLDS